MGNKYYKAYKASQSLGRALKKGTIGTKGYGSAFYKGVTEGFSGGYKESVGIRQHLKKHKWKYGHGALHVAGAGHGYSLGKKHAYSNATFNPAQRKAHKQIIGSLNELKKKGG